MNRENIERAIFEAERFIARAKEVLESEKDEYGYAPERKTAALKRASMDLTMSLPVLRNGLKHI